MKRLIFTACIIVHITFCYDSFTDKLNSGVINNIITSFKSQKRFTVLMVRNGFKQETDNLSPTYKYSIIKC